MGTITDQEVTESNGDGHNSHSGSAFNNTGTTMVLQSTSGITNRFHCFTRFSSVAIPAGSIILSGSINFQVTTGGNGAAGDIYAHDVDNAGIPGSGFHNLAKTTATVPITVPGTPGSVTTADLSAIIQEIIDRPGWGQGNAITFIFFARDTPAAGVSFASFDSTSRVPPRLSVTWQDPAPPAGPPAAAQAAAMATVVPVVPR